MQAAILGPITKDLEITNWESHLVQCLSEFYYKILKCKYSLQKKKSCSSPLFPCLIFFSFFGMKSFKKLVHSFFEVFSLVEVCPSTNLQTPLSSQWVPSLAKVLSAQWASNSPGSTLAFTVGVTSVATKELVCPRISTCSSPNCL